MNVTYVRIFRYGFDKAHGPQIANLLRKVQNIHKY